MLPLRTEWNQIEIVKNPHKNWNLISLNRRKTYVGTSKVGFSIEYSGQTFEVRVILDSTTSHFYTTNFDSKSSQSIYFHIKMHTFFADSNMSLCQLNFRYFLAKYLLFLLNVDFSSETTKTAEKIYWTNDYGMNYYVSWFVNVTSWPQWQILSFVQYVSLSWIFIC